MQQFRRGQSSLAAEAPRPSRRCAGPGANRTGTCFGPEMKVDGSHSAAPAGSMPGSLVMVSRNIAWISIACDVRAEAEVRPAAAERDVLVRCPC